MDAAEIYANFQLVWYDRMIQVSGEILKFISWNFQKGKVLDFGCGPGKTAYDHVLPLVESTDSELYSVDISRSMVDFAKAHYPHPRIHYGVGTLPGDFPFQHEKFDRVLSVNVFHFVPNIKKVLREICDIMKPGGELGFLCVTGNASAVKIWKELAKTPEWGVYMKNCKQFFPEWTIYGKDQDPLSYFRKELLNGTGFEEVCIKLSKFPIHVTNMEAAIGGAISLNPCLGEIPEHLHKELKQDYKKLLQTKCETIIDEDKDTFATDTFELLIGVLRKTEKK